MKNLKNLYNFKQINQRNKKYIYSGIIILILATIGIILSFGFPWCGGGGGEEEDVNRNELSHVRYIKNAKVPPPKFVTYSGKYAMSDAEDESETGLIFVELPTRNAEVQTTGRTSYLGCQNAQIVPAKADQILEIIRSGSVENKDATIKGTIM